MKWAWAKIFWVSLAGCSIGTAVVAQSYYFTGAFVDRQSNPVAYVNIKPFNSTISYQAGNTGEFGIASFLPKDSAWCYLEGYDSLLVILQQGRFSKHVLEIQPSFAEKLIKASRLSSLAKVPDNLLNEQTTIDNTLGESYHQLAGNPWLMTHLVPFSGFVPNNNQSSYANIRRFTHQGTFVPPNAVRIEELWNYFNLKLVAPPAGNDLFSMKAVITPCPWAPAHRLLTINAVARRQNMDSLPAVNMVFLIDNSGSMEASNRLPLLQVGFKKMVEHLRPQDRVGIVTYGGSPGIYLPPTFGAEKEKITSALDSLVAGGATSGSNGIQLAYELATTNAFANGINKVILATDGDFNVGATNENELETLIGRYRSTGVTLSCVGVGMGNYKDSKIEVLARMGNGSFAYLDSEEEAEKVMLQQLGESLYTVAKDVTIQLGFYPSAATAYQLIGYQNKAAALKVIPLQLIGNDVGSGQSIIGMVEFAPRDTTGNKWQPAGFFELQYKWPDKDSSHRLLLEMPTEVTPLATADTTLKTTIALAWMGLELKKIQQPKMISFGGAEQLVTGIFHEANREGNGLLKMLAALRKLYEPQLLNPGKNKRQKRKAPPLQERL